MFIKSMQAINTSGAYLATVTSSADNVTITPMTADRPVLTASRQIPMPRQVVNHLAKAGIVPPADGTKLAIADVDRKMAAAKLSLDERLETKSQLIRANLL